jgi:cytochrome oxidase Cu insertion factor (SCO1/SenC/PrrC family)
MGIVSDELAKTSMVRPAAQSADRRAWLAHLLMWVALGGVLVGVVGLGIWSLLQPQPTATSLPVYGSVPDFSLIDQNHRPLRKIDLEGKIWIVDFIYTNCPDECPLMTVEMAQFQSSLAGIPELRLVSITVDPDHDTSAVLSQYAQRFHADPKRWFFLTGDKSAIYRLAREGFKLAVVAPAEPIPTPVDSNRAWNPPLTFSDRCPPVSKKGTSAWPLILRSRWDQLIPASAFADHGRAKDAMHATRFVLVDQQAQIRGYYDSRDEAAMQRLCQHLQILQQGT